MIEKRNDFNEVISKEISCSKIKLSFAEVNKGDENPTEGALIDDGLKGIHKTSGVAIIEDNAKTSKMSNYLLHKEYNQHNTYLNCFKLIRS